MAILQRGTASLPSPTSISINNEIIWSSNTGRIATSGKMVGDVVANKETISIAWGVLTQAQLDVIENNLPGGFFEITINLGKSHTVTVYRGTIATSYLGKLQDGIHYYKSATVDLIQQ